MATSQVAHFNSQDTQSWRSIFLTLLHLHAQAVRCILGCCKKINPLGRFSSMPSPFSENCHELSMKSAQQCRNNHITTFSIHNLLFTYLFQLQVCWQKTISVLSLAACHFSLFPTIACFLLAWPHLLPEPAGLAQTGDPAVEAFCPKTARVNSSSSSAGAVRPHQRRSKITQHGADGPPCSTAGRRRACECKAELSLGISPDGGWQPRQLPPSQLLCCFLCLPPVIPLNCAHALPIIPKNLFLTWITSLICHCSAPQTLYWHNSQEGTGEKQEGRRVALATTTKAALLEIQPRSLRYFLHTSLQTSQVKGICLW